MFSGIVETQARIESARAATERGLVFIELHRPESFNDVAIGDSICCDGVCLTIDSFTASNLTFALGAETLSVTGWTPENLADRSLNVERSLRAMDRVHGHMVSGHVDTTGTVIGCVDLGGSLQLDVVVPELFVRYVWQKGSWAVNGVSLTVNSIVKRGGDWIVSHCLIPETLRRTNLSQCRIGDKVNLEVDMMARGLVSFLENAFSSGQFASFLSPSSGRPERP